MLEKWVRDASDALGIDAPADTEVLLDVARVVAHRVERRAAPVTTYLVGLAVALRPDLDLDDAVRLLVERAREWRPDEPSGDPTTT
jgi:hypothetical protein